MEIILLIILAIFLWVLISQGLVWKIIVGVFGWIGMYVAMSQIFPKLSETYFIIQNNKISCAIIIPSIILIMAMLYSKNN